jgi:hypothetical protein
MFLIFLILILNIWEEFKVLSRIIQKWFQPPACWDHGLFRILSYYWLSPFYLWKNPSKWCSILVWSADCWFSSNILLTSRNPKNNCWLSSQTRDPNKEDEKRHFCMKQLRTLKFFQKFKIKIKKSKTYSGWCPFQAYSTVPLSGWFNLAGRYL